MPPTRVCCSLSLRERGGGEGGSELVQAANFPHPLQGERERKTSLREPPRWVERNRKPSSLT